MATSTATELKVREPVRHDFEIHADSFNAPPVLRVGNKAFGLFTVCASHSKRTDDPGYVARADAATFESAAVLKRLAARLVDADLWCPEGDGWRMMGRPRDWNLAEPMWRMRPVYRRDPIPDWLRAAVYERDGHACLKCGATDDLTLDHIYPWSLGGADSYSNLRTLCRPCNSSKGAKVIGATPSLNRNGVTNGVSHKNGGA